MFFFSLANLQISSDGFFSFRLGAGQLLPQHLLPHVDGLQRLLDVEEVLLEETERQKLFVLSTTRAADCKTATGVLFTNLTLEFSAAPNNPQYYSINEV